MINEHKGVQYNWLQLEEPVEASASIDFETTTIKGTFALCKMVKSWKFGRQLQFQVYRKRDHDYKVEKRNPSNWNRIEIFLPYNEIDKIIGFLLKLKESETNESNQ